MKGAAEPRVAPTTYEILVRGTLDERTAADIGARCFDVQHGKTAIVLDVIDQSHLHGVLEWLHDRNLAVERVNPI